MCGEIIQQMCRQIKQVIEGLLICEVEILVCIGYVYYVVQVIEVMVQVNKDIFDEYYYVIIFDSRMSNICKGVSQYN